MKHLLSFILLATSLSVLSSCQKDSKTEISQTSNSSSFNSKISESDRQYSSEEINHNLAMFRDSLGIKINTDPIFRKTILTPINKSTGNKGTVNDLATSYFCTSNKVRMYANIDWGSVYTTYFDWYLVNTATNTGSLIGSTTSNNIQFDYTFSTVQTLRVACFITFYDQPFGIWRTVESTTVSTTLKVQPIPAISGTSLLKRYNSTYWTDHFYTIDWCELDGFNGANNYAYEQVEGAVYNTQVSGSVPLYRYYAGHPANNHLYLTSYLGTSWNGYNYEGVVGYVFTTQVSGTVPLYRYFDSSIVDHLYTKSFLGLNYSGYKYEDVACYVLPN